MTRWEPNARGRLELAALELYGQRGYDQTTVAEIAKRAGLTERTFFRYFADKREVLFYGSGMLQDGLVRGIEDAPARLPPIDAVCASLEAVADSLFEERRDRARQRQVIVAATPELQERELIKMATLSVAVAEALRRRGVSDPGASLAGEAGVAVFRVAFQRWVGQAADPGESAGLGRQTLAQLIRQSLAELKAVTAGTERG